MLRFILISILLLNSENILAFTANKVWMEFRSNGRFRVYVNYTVPALKEFREVWVEFDKKKDAEKYFFDLVRGSDFYVPDASTHKFSEARVAPDPW